MGSDSEPGDEPESEEDSAESNPYPIEGKYIDEEDRERYVSPLLYTRVGGLGY